MLSHPLTGSEPGVLWAPPDSKRLLPEHQIMSCREDMNRASSYLLAGEGMPGCGCPQNFYVPVSLQVKDQEEGYLWQ